MQLDQKTGETHLQVLGCLLVTLLSSEVLPSEALSSPACRLLEHQSAKRAGPGQVKIVFYEFGALIMLQQAGYLIFGEEKHYRNNQSIESHATAAATHSSYWGPQKARSNLRPQRHVQTTIKAAKAVVPQHEYLLSFMYQAELVASEGRACSAKAHLHQHIDCILCVIHFTLACVLLLGLLAIKPSHESVH